MNKVPNTSAINRLELLSLRFLALHHGKTPVGKIEEETRAIVRELRELFEILFPADPRVEEIKALEAQLG